LEALLLAVQRGDIPPETEEQLEWLGRSRPRDRPIILAALAQAYAGANRWTDLMPCVDRLLKLVPDHVPGIFMHGQGLEYFGKLEDAALEYERLLDLQAEHLPARWRLAKIYLVSKRPQQAWKQLEVLVSARPNDWDYRLALAQYQYQVGNLADARKLLLQLNAEKPEAPVPPLVLGDVELSAGDPASAEKWLRLALEKDRYQPHTYFVLSKCRLQLGDQTEGETFLKEHQRLTKELDRLLDIRRQILEFTSVAPDLFHEAGQICLRNGQEATALVWFDKALKYAPLHRPTHQALAHYYSRLGKHEAARQHQKLANRPSDVP
jgi:predicted Zn-dependent protease